MSTDSKGNLIAMLTEVLINCDNGQIKVENSTNGLLLKIKDGVDKNWSLIYLNQEETQCLLGAINTVAKERFRDSYRALEGVIKEKDAEIIALRSVNLSTNEAIKDYANKISELRGIIKGKDEAIDSLKDERDMYKCACEKADSELEDYKKTLEGKDLRINEYKNQLEKAHAQINILRQQKDSKPNKWKKKFKALKKETEENTREMEMQIIGRDGTISGKEALIKSMNIQQGDMSTKMKNLESDRDDLLNEIKRLKDRLKESAVVIKSKDSLLLGMRTQRKYADDKIAELERHNNVLTKSDFVIYKGRPIESEFLKEVAVERMNQFEKGRTIEKDVLNNRNGQLIQAAVYCIDNKRNTYPDCWTNDFKESLKKKGRFPKLICSAALLIAHMDMKKYIYDKNKWFEDNKKND